MDTFGLILFAILLIVGGTLLMLGIYKLNDRFSDTGSLRPLIDHYGNDDWGTISELNHVMEKRLKKDGISCTNVRLMGNRFEGTFKDEFNNERRISVQTDGIRLDYHIY